jgi:L-lactate dehydrogenase (cytochrome)
VSLAGTVSADDYRRAAGRRLPRLLFDYIDGGAFDEVTLAANIADLRAVRLRQRVMTGLGEPRLETALLGETLSMPLLLGPVGFAGMAARRGEVQAARAASRAGLPFTLSTVGICPAREVAAAAAPPWFQLYMVRDRAFMERLLAQAWEAGCRKLVLTVDLPAPAPRYRDMRSGMSSTLGFAGRIGRALDGLTHPRWMAGVYLGGRPHTFGNLADLFVGNADFARSWDWIRHNFDPTVCWRDMAFTRKNWAGEIVVKGILDPDDARAAVDAGADAIIVSNHGGRQLDGVASTARCLPRIAEAVDDRLPILVDGGIRSGLDILRMLTLGARACLIGRAWAFALAAGGEAGVSRMLAQMRAELSAAMVLSGCKDVSSAGPQLLDRLD